MNLEKIYLETNSEYNKYKKKIFDSLRLNNKKILDVGYTDYIQPNLKNEFTILDNNKKLLQLAKKNKLEIIKKNLDDDKPLNIKNNSYDVILFLDSLEHLAKAEERFEEIIKKLKNNGLIILSVPNTYNIINRIFFLLNINIDVTDNNHLIKKKIFSDHLHQISFKKIKKLIKKNNLKVTKKYFYFIKKIKRHKNLKFLNSLNNLISFCKLQYLFPNLFSYGIILLIKKNKPSRTEACVFRQRK